MKNEPISLHEYRRLVAKNQMEKAGAQMEVVGYLEYIGLSGGWAEDAAEKGQDLKFIGGPNSIMTKSQVERANSLLARVRKIDMEGYIIESNTVLLPSNR